MTSVLLIDLSSIAHPLYHVSASDPDPNATSTKTVERVRALASGQPHVGVCVEGGRSFRKDLDPSYKANRPESDAALYHQIDLAIDILRADGFPILKAQGFEADDVIATAVGQLRLRSSEVTVTSIVSADKDLLQLVSIAETRGVGPSAIYLCPVIVKSLKDGSILDAAAVEAKFNVRPDQMLDFLALCGDASDNIKGCKNVGKVTAAGLLSRFGSIDKLYAEVDRGVEVFTPAIAASLAEFRPRLDAVRNLIRLRTDAPIDIADVLKERVPLDVVSFGEEPMDEPTSPIEEAVEYQRAFNLQNSAKSDAVALATEPNGMPVKLAGRQAPMAVLDPVGEPSPIEWERQLEPRNMTQMKALSMDLFASKLVFSSTGYGSPCGILSTILAGRELGLSAMASMRGFHVIEGKPTLAADLIRGLVLRSGVVEYFRCTERTNERATFVAKRKGDPEISLTFTIEDGRRAFAGDDKKWAASGWGRNPSDMLVARAGSKLARLVAPDVVSGLYAREELE